MKDREGRGENEVHLGMKVMVPGSTGMLGRAVVERLQAENHLPLPCTRADFDIRDSDSLKRALDRESPDALVNCAAYTAVDKAEDEPELAMEINAHAAERMARACAERGIRFVHLSTDYVFDGAKGSPYKEDDPPNPLNAYGRSKLESERLVQKAYPEGFLIFRSSWLFGPGGRSFVSALLTRLENGEMHFRVVNDEVGRPTYAPDLAVLLVAALEKGLAGIYHACNRGEVSWYDFAQSIFSAAGASSKVRVDSIPSAEWETRAVRPAYSVLDTGRLTESLGMDISGYEDALARYLKTRAGHSRSAL
ncbi:MAG: dTDP-4-dehydrorhamnose reductase [bacterium]